MSYYAAVVSPMLAGAAPPASATHYVNLGSGNDSLDGTTPATAWNTITKLNSTTLAAGSIVDINGSSSTQLSPPASGTSGQPITYRGTGGGAITGYASLTAGIGFGGDRQWLNFEKLDCSLANTTGSVLALAGSYNTTTINANMVFTDCKFHGGRWGIYGKGPNHRDMTLYDIEIYNTYEDGILFDDPSGNNWAFVRGSIHDTATTGAPSGKHGIYASGGSGHLFHGLTFQNNNGDSGLSLRRAGSIVRFCKFLGGAGTERLSYYNEDEAGGVNVYTGSPNTGLVTKIYRNRFNGGVGFWLGDNNDSGIVDPGNAFEVFNNTFLGASFGVQATNGPAYSWWIKNNVWSTSGGLNSPLSVNGGKTLVIDRNGFYNVTSRGTNAITSNPAISASPNLEVTAAAYQNAGTAAIGGGTTMVAADPDDNPIGYLGAAPDIGATEVA